MIEKNKNIVDATKDYTITELSILFDTSYNSVYMYCKRNSLLQNCSSQHNKYTVNGKRLISLFENRLNKRSYKISKSILEEIKDISKDIGDRIEKINS